MKKIKSIYSQVSKSELFRNSAWGIFSNVLQTLFLSVFFAITARKFDIDQFAHFLIATTVYQLIVAFSSMGLGQWFIREFNAQTDKLSFTSKFIKLQVSLGAIFYFVNIILAFILYNDAEILWLAGILGVNIIFDNLIYAIKHLNIAEGRQRTTFSILIIDGFLKLLVGCTLFVYPMSIFVLSIVLLFVRFFTLNLFIKLGSSNTINVASLWRSKVSFEDIKLQILLNWRFVVIGSISIIFWRSANIIISKVLTQQDVADYEIAFRIFSIGLILPTIASATVFAKFIKFAQANEQENLRDLYNKVFLVYNIFSFLFYAFIFSFSHTLIPLAFGGKFDGAITCVKQMFLAFLLFPTLLLQANLIVAMKAEKIDMWLNILSLILMLVFCFTGLYFEKSLTVINYAILLSFGAFHIFQNVFLIKKGITTIAKSLAFYLIVSVFVILYSVLSVQLNEYLVFAGFSVIILAFASYKFINIYKKSVIE